MKTSSKMLFTLMTLISTIMVMNSSSWINMWIGLEINLMSFTPLISKSKNMLSSESAMMYFLIQSMASMLFIITILTYKYMFIYSDSKMLKLMIIITMMMKMGMPPFHMWFPEIMNKMSWMMCFILMTWQKVAPMYIMSLMMEMNKTLTMIVCLSATIGAVGGLNKTSTRKIMAYSSITHMSWMIICAATFKKSWMLYMLMYTMLMAMLSMTMFKYNIMFINQLKFFCTKKINKIIIIFMMLSIGGVPPFLGFLPKWITIQYMISSKEFIMMLIMTMSALITLSYYMRMSSSLNLLTSESQKWMTMLYMNEKIPIYTLMLNMTLPLFIFTMNFY